MKRACFIFFQQALYRPPQERQAAAEAYFQGSDYIVAGLDGDHRVSLAIQAPAAANPKETLRRRPRCRLEET
jgi:hypothetical protein